MALRKTLISKNISKSVVCWYVQRVGSILYWTSIILNNKFVLSNLLNCDLKVETLQNKNFQNTKKLLRFHAQFQNEKHTKKCLNKQPHQKKRNIPNSKIKAFILYPGCQPLKGSG